MITTSSTLKTFGKIIIPDQAQRATAEPVSMEFTIRLRQLLVDLLVGLRRADNGRIGQICPQMTCTALQLSWPL